MSKRGKKPKKPKRFDFHDVFRGIIDTKAVVMNTKAAETIVDKKYTLSNKHVLSVCELTCWHKKKILGKLLQTNIDDKRMNEIEKHLKNRYDSAMDGEAKENFADQLFSLPCE